MDESVEVDVDGGSVSVCVQEERIWEGITGV